ncbi:MAG: alcohol dehydrogenase catalytic domain-containing protein, partial [Planctomycetota bacterium]|nr:alcohol dehydrogenase catalytic domain-containing protein [Planctomycetota bacterium]
MATERVCAAVFVAAGEKMAIQDYPVLSPKPRTGRLRLLRSGICGTDIHILEGRLKLPPPCILGHEFVGRIDALGKGAARDGLGQPLRVGD